MLHYFQQATDHLALTHKTNDIHERRQISLNIYFNTAQEPNQNITQVYIKYATCRQFTMNKNTVFILPCIGKTKIIKTIKLILHTV